MKILFKRNFHDHKNGVSFLRDPRGTEVPDELCERDEDGKFKYLPASCKVVGEDELTAREERELEDATKSDAGSKETAISELAKKQRPAGVKSVAEKK